MKKSIAVLAGDGIGPEIMAEAIKVLDTVAEKFGHEFSYKKALIGGAAYDAFGEHFPEATQQTCAESDAILFGSVGGPVAELNQPKWQNCEVNALLGIRKAFGFGANLRPAKVYPELQGICPLRDEVIGGGVDLLIVRELLGGIYFGEKKNFKESGKRVATDECRYDEDTIASIAKVAFETARKRRKHLTSVDKANVLNSSRLWRTVVTEVSQDYPDIEYVDMLVDNAAMQIISNPSQFDVVVTSNMFGDILSDSAAVLPGSLGLTPSASLNKVGFGMYEPSGGSAPDIAGKGIANPIAQILSAAMMLKYSFNLQAEADSVEAAVEKTIKDGIRTGDIQGKGAESYSTCQVGDRIVKHIKE